MTKKADNNDLIYIKLDRPRFLRYGHKALKQLTALTGTNIEQIDEKNFDFADLEKILWCGLQADAKANNEELKLEDMEDLLDSADSYGDIMEAMNKALEKSFQRTEKEKN